MRTKTRPGIGRILAWVYLIAILLITIFPFYWILRTALSDNYALLANPSSILPVDFTWGPFRRVLGLATPEEALANVRDAIEGWLAVARDRGFAIPEPRYRPAIYAARDAA